MDELGVEARTNEASVFIWIIMVVGIQERKFGEGMRAACDLRADLKQMQLN